MTWTIEQLLADSLAFAKEEYAKGDRVDAPVVLYGVTKDQGRTHKMDLRFPFPDPRLLRNVAIHMLRMIDVDMGLEVFTFCSEAWMATFTKEEKEIAERLEREHDRIEDYPEQYRKEVFVVSCVARNKVTMEVYQLKCQDGVYSIGDKLKDNEGCNTESIWSNAFVNKGH
jgi:hypothetical protein